MRKRQPKYYEGHAPPVAAPADAPPSGREFWVAETNRTGNHIFTTYEAAWRFMLDRGDAGDDVSVIHVVESSAAPHPASPGVRAALKSIKRSAIIRNISQTEI